MKKNEIIEQLESLAEYTADIMEDDILTDDVWEQDTEALGNAIIAIQMLYDIFDNLEGQGLKGEMIAILTDMGYDPEDFENLEICTEEEVEEYLEDYDD